MPSTNGSDSGVYRRIDQLADEFAERYRRGERPSLEEYVDRHPELAGEIRELFPALARLGQAEEDLHREAPDDGPPPELHRLGDFQIVREVGRGGMGVVYEAEQASLGRRVALKVLPRHAAHDRGAMERFRREARAAARLQHANIVPVYEVGQEGDVSFYVMQFIRGQGLDAVIDELRRIRARTRTGAPASPSPAPALSVIGPLAEGPEAIPRRAAEANQVARSLLTGRLGPEPPALPKTEGDGPTGDGRRTATVELISRGTHTPQSSPPRPDREAESTSATGAYSSAVLPGGSQLSTAEDRGYFRGVAHVGRQAAQALAYAHARGVVHRDIKPSNLLLDAEGVVWVTDFGLAKADDDDLTATGDIIGTLRYMAPERFRGEGDGRADVYALGLTLYELLTLRPAFDSPDRLRLVERIKLEEPTRPRALDSRVPRDLETIVIKASDKDPRRRYATADELAEDLRRFLDGEPIRARRVGETERAWKWAKRRPALAMALALLAASMVAGTVVSTSFAIRATERASAALVAQKEAQAAQHRAEQAEHASSLQSAGLLLDRGLALAEKGEVGDGLLWMVEALRTAPGDATALHRAIRTNIAAWDRRLARVRHFIPCEAHIRAVAIRPDGAMIATSHADSRVRRWDPRTGTPLGPPLGEPALRQIPDDQIAFSVDGRTLFASGDRLIRWFDVGSGEAIDPPRQDTRGKGAPAEPCGQFLLRPDGGLLITAARVSRSLSYWDARTGALLDASGRVPSATAGMSAFLPDGRLFVATGREVSLWDRDARRRLAGPWTFPAGVVRAWASPDGRSYFTHAPVRGIQQVDLATGNPIGEPTRIPQEIRNVQWTPDGRAVIYRDLAGSNCVFVPAAPTAPDPFRSLHGGTLAIAPGGRWFASPREGHLLITEFGDDWAVPVARKTPAPSAKEDPETRWKADLRSGWRVEFSPDRSTVMIGPLELDKDTIAFSLRETATGRPRPLLARFAPPPPRLAHWLPIAFSPDGRRVAVACGTVIQVLDTRSGRPIGPPLRHADTICCLAFSPDGATLAAGGFDQQVRFWDPATGRASRPPLDHPDLVLSVAFSPDGRSLAAGTAAERSGKAAVRLWDLAADAPIGPDLPHPNGWIRLSYSPDGRTLLASADRSLQFVDAQTGRREGAVQQFGEEFVDFWRHARCVLFAGDRRVVAGTSKGTLRLFDATAGQPIPGKVMNHPNGAAVIALAVSPDGRTALTGHNDGTARLWDLEAAKPIGPPVRACRSVLGVAFTPDGRSALVTSDRGRTWRWPVPKPAGAGLDRLALHLEVDTRLRLDTGPSVAPLNVHQWLERSARLRATGASPPTPPVPPVDDAEWHAFRAFEAEETEGADTALWHLERLAPLRPDDRTIAWRIGALHADAGRWDRAAEVYDRAEAGADGDEPGAWYRLRFAECRAAGRSEAARRYLERILAREPQDAQAIADRAAIPSTSGDAAGDGSTR